MRPWCFDHLAERTALGRLFIASLLLACLLYACAPNAAGQTTLTIVRVGGEIYEELAREYTALNPHIEIRFIPNVATETYEGISQILLMEGTVNQPDIIHAYLGIVPEMYYMGMFAQPPEHIVQRAHQLFIPQILQGLTFDGRLMGLPTENQTFMLGYNERVLEEVGVFAPPTTWSELSEVAPKLTRIGPDGDALHHAMSINPSSIGDPVQFAHGFLGFLWSNGGTDLDEQGTPRFSEEPGRETVFFLHDLMGAGHLAFDGRNVINGGSAMSVMPTWWMLQLQDVQSFDPNEVRAAPLPIQAGPVTAPQYGWGLFVSSKSPNQDEAWKFLEWLTMALQESGRTRMGDIQARLSLPTNLFDLEDHPRAAQNLFQDFLASLNHARSEAPFPQISARQLAIGETIAPAIRGETPVVEALIELNRRTELLLQQSVFD